LPVAISWLVNGVTGLPRRRGAALAASTCVAEAALEDDRLAGFPFFTLFGFDAAKPMDFFGRCLPIGRRALRVVMTVKCN